jgi:alkyl sulfatase BDS1-like metallo-beta-lactamase superfamily hydrolase
MFAIQYYDHARDTWIPDPGSLDYDTFEKAQAYVDAVGGARRVVKTQPHRFKVGDKAWVLVTVAQPRDSDGEYYVDFNGVLLFVPEDDLRDFI